MATKNDITGDLLTTRVSSKKYAEGWDRIFGRKDESKDANEEDRQNDQESESRESN